MKKIVGALAVLVTGVAGSALAQVPVNIVYPTNGASYPITDPATSGLKSAYFTASFGATCKGDHKVQWGFDSATLGNTVFYDQISVQFVHKLPGGKHKFWVKADCGSDAVSFAIK